VVRLANDWDQESVTHLQHVLKLEKCIALACLFGILMVLLLGTGGAWATEGVVKTRDGKVYSGTLRLDRERVIVVDRAQTRIVPVEAANLRRVVFDSPRLDPRDRNRVGMGSDGGLPARWSQRVVGAGGVDARVTVQNGRFSLMANGMIDATEDQSHFVYTPVRGNREIMARVVSVESGQLAGLMMRESLETNATQILLGLRGGRGGMLRWRERGDYRTSVKEPRINVPDWLRLKRVGDTFSAFRSSQGRRWDLIERITIPMAEEFYVGMACGVLNADLAGRHPKRRAAMVDHVREDRSLATSGYAPRVTLRSGSMVAGGMHSQDGAIHFRGPDRKPTIPFDQVATLNFQYLPGAMSQRVDLGRPGVLLVNGEFIDGRFRGINDGLVTISSVLFGVRQFDLNNEIRAVVVKGMASSGSRYEIETADGSLWLASRLEIGENEILIWEPLLGAVRIPVYQLAQIRENSD